MIHTTNPMSYYFYVDIPSLLIHTLQVYMDQTRGRELPRSTCSRAHSACCHFPTEPWRFSCRQTGFFGQWYPIEMVLFQKNNAFIPGVRWFPMKDAWKWMNMVILSMILSLTRFDYTEPIHVKTIHQQWRPPASHSGLVQCPTNTPSTIFGVFWASQLSPLPICLQDLPRLTNQKWLVVEHCWTLLNPPQAPQPKNPSIGINQSHVARENLPRPGISPPWNCWNHTPLPSWVHR